MAITFEQKLCFQEKKTSFSSFWSSHLHFFRTSLMGSVSQTQYLESCWPSQWRSTETLKISSKLPPKCFWRYWTSLERKLVWMDLCIVQPFLPRIKQHPTRAKPQGHKISSCQNNLDFAECTMCPSDLIWWWYNVAQNLSIGKTISSAWTKSMFSYLSPNQPEPPPLFLLRKERFSSSIKILFWWKQLVHDRKKVRVRRLPGQLGAKEREPESESEIASFLKKKHFHFSEKEKTLSLSPTPELSSSKTRPCI